MSEDAPYHKEWPQTELTPAQEIHNMQVDYEIARAERDFQHRLERDRLMGRITMYGPKKVIALKYAI